MKMRKRPTTNFHAVALLRSWLRTVGIPYHNMNAGGIDLSVGCKNGDELLLRVSIEDEPREYPGTMTVAGLVITYGELDESLGEFARVTRAAGYGTPRPFNRGAEPETKPRHGHGFEDLVVFRHNTFRRAPDLTADKIREYENVVGMAAKMFYTRNRVFLMKLGHEFGDLMTYSWLWATNYVAHFELPCSGNDNQKLMLAYLKQRFIDLRKKLGTQYENCCSNDRESFELTFGESSSPDTGNYRHRATRSQIVFGGGLPKGLLREEHLEDPNADRRQIDIIPGANGKTRREQARDCLQKNLSALPHDRLLEVLRDASVNLHFEPVAREEAAKQLKLHQGTCYVCTPSLKTVAKEVFRQKMTGQVKTCANCRQTKGHEKGFGFFWRGSYYATQSHCRDCRKAEKQKTKENRLVSP
jgi:hypothetical protein